jgi:hypothetical protein
MTENTRVGAADFAADEDLPIGQVLRRFGERRLGLAHDDNALTPVQERLAVLMANRAVGVQDRSQPAVATRRRGLHLDVGSRYLPLRVDATFGRFGAFEHQDLMPKGNWVYQLDANLLRLWVEEELEADAEANGWLRAESWAAAPATRTPEADRVAAAQSRPTHKTRQRIGTQLPPAVRKSLAPHREQVRKAVLAAVRGDTSALARMTHGSAVAKRLLAKIEARRASSQVAQRTTGRTEAAASPASEREKSMGLATQTALPRFAASLDHDDLIALRDQLPMLAVDASDVEFSFEGAAQDIMRTARVAVSAQRNAARRGETPAPRTGTPALARALQMASSRISAHGRMFGESQTATGRSEASALALTPFTPRLAEISAGPEIDISVADHRVANRLEALSQTGSARRAEFGSQALKAVRFDSRAARHAEPDVSTHWLMEGGRGVLLAGLDDSGVGADPGGATWHAPEAAATTHRTAPVAQLLAAAVAAATPQALISTSALGDFGSQIASGYAPHSIAELRLDAPPQQLVSQQLSRVAPRPGAPTIAPERAAPVSFTPLALAAASRRTYDATTGGDFAAIVAGGLAEQIVARSTRRSQARRLPTGELGSLSDTAGATQGVAGEPRRRRSASTTRTAVLQDVVVNASYLPTLVRSIAELQRAAGFLGRLRPTTLASTSRAQPAQVARQGANQLGTVIARLTALTQSPSRTLAAVDGPQLETRAARAAGDLAEAIREARQTLTRSDDGAAPGYDNAGWWGVDSVLLEMESAAAQTDTFVPWAADHAGISDLQRAVAVASQRAQTAVVAQLAQIASASHKAAQTTQQQTSVPREAAVTRSDLRLFSAEKTVALIAPELESGGLLDVGARRALSQALEALSQSSAQAVATRSVRTPFGNITVRLDHGKIVVDTEEISSNAPIVSVATAAHRSANRSLSTAPTRTARAFAQVAAGREPEPGGSTSAYTAGALARVLETRLPPVLANLRGVSAQLDVLLGGPARAEMSSHAATRGSMVAAAADVRSVQSKLESVLAASPSQMTSRFAALTQSTSPLATSRLDAAGDVIRLFAGSDRAARVIQTLSAGGFAHAEAATVGALGERQPLPTSIEPAAATPAVRIQLGQLGAALATLGTDRSVRVARVLRDLSEGRNVALPVAARSAQALGELLAEAADARSIGSLGQVGMARHVAPGMSRADLAYILPYAQRATQWSQEQTSQSGESIAPGSGATTKASSLFEMALSLGRGRELLDGVQALNLSAAGTAGPRNIDLADSTDMLASPGRIGLGLTNAGRSAPGYHQISGAETAFVAPGAAINRSLAAREGARFNRLESALATPAMSVQTGRRSAGRRRGVLAPRALSAGVLRNLLQVRSALTDLGNRPEPGAGPQLQVGTAGAGALLSPERARLGAADVAWHGQHSAAAPAQEVQTRADGTAGVWIPAGVERLVAETADSLVSGRSSLAGTLVAPRLLTPQRTRGRSRHGARRGSTGQNFEAVAHQVAMGLRSLRMTPGTGGRAESAGSLLAVGAGAGALNASPWLTSTRSQEGARRLAASLGMEWIAPGTGRAQAAAGVELQSPDLVAPGGAKSGDGPGALFKPPAPPPKPRARAAKAPGELYSPPTPPSLPAAETFGPGGTKPDAAVAPRAARTQDTSGGMVERAEAEDRTGMAHQSGVPSQENIEDIAYEVLSELKRRWGNELERRGTE